LCALRDYRRSVDTGRLAHERVEELRDASEIEIGICGDDARSPGIGFAIGGDDHRPGFGRIELRAVALAGVEADLTRIRRFERGHLVDQRVGGACHAAAESGDDLRERHRPGHGAYREVTWPAACRYPAT